VSIVAALSRSSRFVVWMSRLLAAMFLFAGMTKLLGADRDIQHFAAWRYPDWFRPIVGSIEVVSAVLLLIPRAEYLGAAGIGATLLWTGYTFLVRVPQESLRALPTLMLLVLVAMVAYARRPGRTLRSTPARRSEQGRAAKGIQRE
jgi:putative oxidoreductase